MRRRADVPASSTVDGVSIRKREYYSRLPFFTADGAVLAESLVGVRVALCSSTGYLRGCEVADVKSTEAGVAGKILVGFVGGRDRSVCSDRSLHFVDFELLECLYVSWPCACEFGVCGELVEVSACGTEHLQVTKIEEGYQIDVYFTR